MFKNIIRNSQAIIAAKDLDGRYVYANEACTRMLGIPGDRLLGLTDHDLFPRPLASALQAADRSAISSGKAETTEVVLPVNGATHHLLCRIYPVLDAHDEAVASAVLALEQPRPTGRESPLHHNEERIQDILDNISDWVWEIDTEGNFSYVSSGVKRILGYAPEEVLQMNAFDLMSEEEARRVGAVYESIIAHRQPFRDMVNVNQHKDGRPVTILSSGVPFFDEAGNLAGYRGADRDITARVRAEDQARQARQEKQQALAEAEMKSRFLSTMSHELRTPMNAIIGMTRLALSADLDERQEKLVSRAHATARHLLDIVNDILDLSKMEAGELQLEERAFSLADVLEQVSDMVGEAARDKSVELAIVVDEGTPQNLLGDPLRLTQVLVNLCSNAVKFSHQHGRVRLGVSASNGPGEKVLFEFTVDDNGIGMNATTLDNLFKPFFQAERSTARRFGGTGLGLAISRDMVALMGGSIGVESTEGSGSSFRVSLPLGLSAQGRAGPVLTLEEEDALLTRIAARIRGVRLLLVDDDEINRELVLEFCHDHAIAVGIAHDGREALEKLEDEPFDCVLMDCEMPVMNGYEATRRIRANNRLAQLPVIALTANSMQSERERTVEAGMNDFVSKPVDFSLLMETIARLVRP